MATLKEEKIKGFLSSYGLVGRPCDTCRSATALLYCHPHSSFLCGACDSNLHRHALHERVWLCEVCEQAPAAVTCKADAAALCTACDRDIHSANPLARRHVRLPVVPFRSTSDDLAAAPTYSADADDDSCLIPNPNFFLNDSDVFDLGFDCQDHEVKNQHNRSLENCGFDFADNVSFSYDTSSKFEDCFDIDLSHPSKQSKQMISALSFSAQPNLSSSDIGIVPDTNANSLSEASYTYTTPTSKAFKSTGVSSVTIGAPPAPGIDRVARVLRYREKRKNRKFEKTIRYASRKAYAEARPRVKGRFAKRTDTNETSEIERIFGIGSGPTGYMVDVDQGGYGVVPSFP